MEEYENKTLDIMMAKIYKKRYQRSADFQNIARSFFWINYCCFIYNSVTLAWGMNSNNDDINDGGTEIL